MYHNEIDFTHKYLMEIIDPPGNTKPNKKPYLKSIDYNEDKQQSGWSLELVKCGKDACPFICSICLGLPKFPVEILSCGDTFCFDCIGALILRNIEEHSIYNSGRCPNCKDLFETKDIQAFEEVSKALYRVYTSIDVSCSYGCGLITSTKSLVKHEMWECRKRPVKCPNGCNKVLPDTEMEAHLDECEHRLVYCNKCKLPKILSEKKHACVKALTDTINRMFVCPHYVMNSVMNSVLLCFILNL